MARIAGIDLPRDKRIVIGLTYIYGIGGHTTEETLTCIVDQLLCFVADFPTGDRSRRVTVIAIQNGANVEADDIPFANNNVRRRDTMYNYFIDRGADRSWEPAIVLKGRDRSSTPNITLGNLIEFERTHTWA